MITKRQPPRNFLVLYSAAFGEQAVESFSGWTQLTVHGSLPCEMMRPGQSLKDLAERVKLMVRATAQSIGEQQEPEYTANGPNLERNLSDRPIGRRTFPDVEGKVRRRRPRLGGDRNRRKHELFERHVRRFDRCDTAEYARRRLAELALSADDSDEFQDRCLEANDDWEADRENAADRKAQATTCSASKAAQRASWHAAGLDVASAQPTAAGVDCKREVRGPG